MNNDTLSPLLVLLPKNRIAHIDPIDRDLLDDKWRLHELSTTYARTAKYIDGKNTTIYMHRIIMERIIGRELIDGEQVDHIDMNGLNNTRANLRLATMSQNQANAKAHSHNQLGVKGVRKLGNKYSARITVKGKEIQLGRFDTVELASEAYRKAALEHFGEFARDK